VPGGRKQTFTNAEAAEALHYTKGMVMLAAERLGVCPQTLMLRMNKSPELRAIVKQYRERRTDVAESKLGEAVERGETWAVLFQLRTQGQARGFMEGRKVEHSGEIAMPQVTVVEVRVPGEDTYGTLEGQQ